MGRIKDDGGYELRIPLNIKSFTLYFLFIIFVFFTAYIYCPGSYLCNEDLTSNVSKCVKMEEVCDGSEGCPGGDDETMCRK